MEKKERKMVNTNLGILLICLFSSIFTLVDFIVIDKALDKYVDCSKCTKCDVKDNGTVSGNTDNTPVIDDKKTDDSISFCDKATTNVCNNFLSTLIGSNNDYVLDSDSNIRTVSDKISLVRFSKYADVDVVDGGLVFNVHNYTIDEDTKSTILVDSETITYSIPGESIKYIYTYYDQPSGLTVIYALTESGNLYRSKYSHFAERYNFSSVTDFSLVNSNVSELRIVDNVRINESGEEFTSKDIAAVINGETIILNKWD